MIATDEHALICDLAETYRIYDYRSLPVRLVATFSAGLREDSRIMMKLRGDKLGDSNRLVLGMLYDALVALGWTDDTPPPSMVDAMYGDLTEKKKKPLRSFDSPQEYERARKALIGRSE